MLYMTIDLTFHASLLPFPCEAQKYKLEKASSEFFLFGTIVLLASVNVLLNYISH